jgi:predicted dehydrogenase
LEDGLVGAPSHIFFRYLRDRELPHLPDYLFAEDDPLLFAMAIHHFDLFRSTLGQEFSLVDARSARPAWSRYRNPSILQAWLETENGVVVSYAATFSSRNAFLPLESLQVEGELGTLHNESTYSEPPLLLSLRGTDRAVDLTEDETVRDVAGQYELADRLILENFRNAVIDGEPLIAPGRDNLGTIATVAAVALSCREARAVDPRALLVEAEAMESHA